ncbi:hypothetical protein BDR05DRAFT_943719 [Suillus weaverae]|nr:hypothetical protein BDR05DRAFT_943719 [Suillus weaverae]
MWGLNLCITCNPKLSKSSFRDNTFVWYKVLYISVWGHVVCYDQLNSILKYHLDDNNCYGDLHNLTLLFALIIPYTTDGLDAFSKYIKYKQLLVPIIMDIQNIKAAIGCVCTRRHWGIIDHSTNHIQITFTELGLKADVKTDDTDDASTGDFN